MNGIECDLLAVGRPAWQKNLQGRKSELKPLTSIHLAAPEDAIGVRSVGNPLPISGECQTFGRDSREIGCKLSTPSVVADYFGAMGSADGEDLLAVRAQQRI